MKKHNPGSVNSALTCLPAFLLAFLLAFSPLAQIMAQEVRQESVPSENRTSVQDEPKTAIDVSEEEVIEPVKSEEEFQQSSSNSMSSSTAGGFLLDTRDTPTANLPQTDQATGGLSYEYLLSVPPGRNGLQPELKLQYSNQNSDIASEVGYGWSLNIPYIERLNKTGVDRLYTDNYFTSSIAGELVNITGNEYGPKTENGDFLKYDLSSDIWTVIDKKGTVYIYGVTADARQDDPNDSSIIYKWMLEEVRDTNDNYIKYEYYKADGQIYPYKITYTGNGTTDGIFEVEFALENRSDVITQNKTGFSVITSDRIKSIEAKINGDWVRKYDLGYTPGDNSERSLLSSITESGKDQNANVTALPPTTFSYQIASTGVGQPFASDWNWATPVSTSISTRSSFGAVVADVNKDALPDIMESYENAAPVLYKGTYLNKGDGTWTLDTNLNSPIIFSCCMPTTEQGIRSADLNGDALIDLVQSGNTGGGSINQAYINSGSSWTLDTNWVAPFHFVSATYGDVGARMADINGDNLPDFFRAFDAGGSIDTVVRLNNGTEWVQSLGWDIPVDLRFGVVPVDYNGDGLLDFLKGYRDGFNVDHQEAYKNNGDKTWSLDANYAPQIIFAMQMSYSTLPIGTTFSLGDVNGDGLIDILAGQSSTLTGAYLNTGSGWHFSTDWGFGAPALIINDPAERIADFDGDGMIDFYTSHNGATLSKNQRQKADLLIGISNPAGASSTIEYKTSPKYLDGNGDLLNPELPFVLDTVHKITTDDNNGNVATTEYSYEGGQYYFNDYLNRKFAGFHIVTKTDAVGNITNTYYHQGDASNSSVGEYNDHVSKIGKIYRVENYDSSGNLYKKTINTWDKYNLGTGRDFVKLAQSVSSDYDGNSTHKDIAESYTYDDTNGNTLTKTEWGEVTGANDGTFTDTGIDDRKTTLTYATDGAYLVGLPETEKVTDHSNVTVKEILHEYDGQALGTVTLGNETKTKELITSGAYKTTEKDYDGTYGLVVASRDALSNQTDYSYDTYNLYPETVTDTLSIVEKYFYDYSSGKVTDYYDKNSNQFTTVYDGLGRPLEEKIPSTSGQVTKAMYAYDDVNFPNSVYKRNYLNSSLTTDSYTYMDGLGRPIQTRTQAATAGDYRVSDTIYDALGRVYKQSLPYFASGSAHTAPTSTAALYSESLYDPLGRITKISNTVGDTLYAYDNWYTEITDPNGKIKGYEKDAFGNLVKVDEHNQAATYTTRYYWDATGNLASIKDASNNVRAFAYDKLGRRISADDLHTLADTTFGLWQYVYDDQGNLKSRIDAAGVQTDYNYDQLNRVIKEDDTSNSGLDISFAYDTCANGVSKLCTVTQLSGTTTDYDYDLVGNVASETETISSTGYTTAYTYDYQNNITNINYPDSADVMYDYNDAGMVKSISRQEPGSSVLSVMDAVDYAENGKPSSLDYANGMKIGLTYDPAQLYRLVNISGVPFQDISYTYDPVGNILNITDVGTGDAAKDVDYTYDDLHRLTDARTNSVATGSTYNENYRYDALGNFTYFNAIPYSYAGNTGTNYANPHAVTSVNSVAYTYDNNGNLTSDSTNSYLWDYRNEMVKAVTPSATNIYTYDHTGKRLTLYDGTVTTVTPNKYYDKDNSSATKRIYLGDMQVATILNGTTETYFTPDHLNSTSYGVDSTGTVTQALDYYPFGKIRVNSGTTNEIHKYIGQRYDNDTGLNYLNARYYNSPIGRFTSQDPVHLFIGDPNEIEKLTKVKFEEILKDPQSLNSYSYAKNNPIINKDPEGEFAVLAIPILAAAGIGTGEIIAVGGALVGGTALYYGTKNMVERVKNHGWGRDYGGQVPMLDPSKFGFGNPPMGPEDMIPNLNPKIPDWAKWVAGGVTVGTILTDQYKKIKETVDFGKTLRSENQHENKTHDSTKQPINVNSEKSNSSGAGSISVQNKNLLGN